MNILTYNINMPLKTEIEKYDMILQELRIYDAAQYKQLNMQYFYLKLISQQEKMLKKITKRDCIIMLDRKEEVVNILFTTAVVSLNMLQKNTEKLKIDIIKTNRALFMKKNRDYGNSYKDFGLIGILVRLNDKINRIKALHENNKNEVDEQIEETINDLYNYCIIGLMYKIM